MKTYIEYEAKDIKIDSKNEIDPLHMFLLTQVLVTSIMGLKLREEDGDDKLMPAKRVIAEMLNAMTREGWVLTKAELPLAFKAIEV